MLVPIETHKNVKRRHVFSAPRIELGTLPRFFFRILGAKPPGSGKKYLGTLNLLQTLETSPETRNLDWPQSKFRVSGLFGLQMSSSGSEAARSQHLDGLYHMETLQTITTSYTPSHGSVDGIGTVYST
jgi:hypothetical protein